MMTRKELIENHKAWCDEMHETLIRKNADYAGDSVNPFANFTRVEALGICSPEQGFLTRMSDKFSRITTFATVGVLRVKDESVTDTLKDLAVYAFLMAMYIKSKRDSAHPEGELVEVERRSLPERSALARAREALTSKRNKALAKRAGAVDKKVAVENETV